MLKNITVALSLVFGLMLVSDLAQAAADGKALFDAKCAACHKDGAKLTKANEAKFEETISTGKAPMPGYKDKLTAEEIKAVAAEAKSRAK